MAPPSPISTANELSGLHTLAEACVSSSTASDLPLSPPDSRSGEQEPEARPEGNENDATDTDEDAKATESEQQGGLTSANQPCPTDGGPNDKQDANFNPAEYEAHSECDYHVGDSDSEDDDRSMDERLGYRSEKPDDHLDEQPDLDGGVAIARAHALGLNISYSPPTEQDEAVFAARALIDHRTVHSPTGSNGSNKRRRTDDTYSDQQWPSDNGWQQHMPPRANHAGPVSQWQHNGLHSTAQMFDGTRITMSASNQSTDAQDPTGRRTSTSSPAPPWWRQYPSPTLQPQGYPQHAPLPQPLHSQDQDHGQHSLQQIHQAQVYAGQVAAYEHFAGQPLSGQQEYWDASQQAPQQSTPNTTSSYYHHQVRRQPLDDMPFTVQHLDTPASAYNSSTPSPVSHNGVVPVSALTPRGMYTYGPSPLMPDFVVPGPPQIVPTPPQRSVPANHGPNAWSAGVGGYHGSEVYNAFPPVVPSHVNGQGGARKPFDPADYTPEKLGARLEGILSGRADRHPELMTLRQHILHFNPRNEEEGQQVDDLVDQYWQMRSSLGFAC